jgi:hypothetical protein
MTTYDVASISTRPHHGVCCLRFPVPKRVHIQVRESGGSSGGCRGSRAAPVAPALAGALCGIARRLATFLTRRHLTG